MEFRWNEDKNTRLKSERNVCFEDVVVCLNESRLLDTVKNPNKTYENQYCMIVDIGAYAYVVPFVIEKEYIFLKTIYPSRKMTKKYLGV